jgi:hypothetical protein
MEEGRVYASAVVFAPSYILQSALLPKGSVYEHYLHLGMFPALRQCVCPQMSNTFWHILQTRDPTPGETNWELFRVNPARQAYRTRDTFWLSVLTASFVATAALPRHPLNALLWANVAHFMFQMGGCKRAY